MGWRSVLVCILVTALGGCSFAFVREPKDERLRDPHVSLDCTQSRTLPLADLAIGAILGGLVAGATYTAIEEANEDCPGCVRGTGPALLAAFLVVSPWWISSAVGFSDTSRCRKLHQLRPAALP